MSSQPESLLRRDVGPDAGQDACNLCRGPELWGLDPQAYDHLVALAGCPNVGKSTVFNALTGLRQHTGNWPGKTVARAEGGFERGGASYKLVDLPGIYTLLSPEAEERIAHDSIVYGQADVTVIVVDADQLERNLSFVLQVLEATDRAVVCLNLIDEAERHGARIDADALEAELGVPVVPTVARYGRGIDELVEAVHAVASGSRETRPYRFTRQDADLEAAVREISDRIRRDHPGVPGVRWTAVHLLDGDGPLVQAVRYGQLWQLAAGPAGDDGDNVVPLRERGLQEAMDRGRALVARVEALRRRLDDDIHARLVGTLHGQASRLAAAVTERIEPRRDVGQLVDRLVTSRWLGFPLMLALLTAVFWVTIAGANVPSGMLATLFLDTIHPALEDAAAFVGLPWWLDGLLIDGVYLSTAWVVSVMLPPMAIFFPVFTLLEDLGYLARVSFNLDHLFQKVGAHGKQALTMSMGFGCNAAGVIATRVIDSPRERLIAIITNNFALCNGRWPTQILVATIFIGGLAPAWMAGLVSAAAVVGVATLGVLLTFLVSWGLSRTVLKGEASTFNLELPPYRRPRLLQTLYTSLIDRTIFVLWRAVVFAVPAGAAIWLSANVRFGGASVAEHVIAALDPVGALLGLNGVILVAYVLAIPANEIVIPTILMLTVLSGGMLGVGEGAGVMFELDSAMAIGRVLTEGGGWTLLTAVNLMLFSLIHNPCSTTIYTIYKETGSARWTAVASLLPVAMGLGVTFAVATVWRLLA